MAEKMASGYLSRSSEAVQEDEAQYGPCLIELREKFPNKPENHSRTLPFSQLIAFFNRQMNWKPQARVSKTGAKQKRGEIVDRFIQRWRREVGDDIYPAFRLILPDRDRDRGVYGLKEGNIAKHVIRMTGMSAQSDDGSSLIDWKRPGSNAATSGDFPARCYEVLSKRPMLTEPGKMSIAQVNVSLDKLAAASGFAEQELIFTDFYQKMCAEELSWLIRIILKEIHIGVRETTMFEMWHKHANEVWNVSSSLRRVCWDLAEAGVELEAHQTSIRPMSCFQPQFASYQATFDFGELVERLDLRGGSEFVVEEKLDGERMQVHMVGDDSVAGGFRFAYWSRKGKEYSSLYGRDYEDTGGSLTRFLGGAFTDEVESIVLDGEMVTYDPALEKVLPFGTLKTAAKEQKADASQHGPRPLFCVFDILYYNGHCLTGYPLYLGDEKAGLGRRELLQRLVPGVRHRLHVHDFELATSPEAIQDRLGHAVEQGWEGLVLKNPRSLYQVNVRAKTWMKVKPEYMQSLGENVDCVVIGAYYGGGKRGGTLASFLCGVRVREDLVPGGQGQSAERCFSFFRVGGGLSAFDYDAIRVRTEGRWRRWSRAAFKYIALGGGEERPRERPDVWIRPSESFVIEAKAASISESDEYATGCTLRFPRFRRIHDKAWDQGLDANGLEQLLTVAKEHGDLKMESRPGTRRKRVKKEVIIAGADANGKKDEFATTVGSNKVFDGLDFLVLSGCKKPERKTTGELGTLIKAHGGRVHHQDDAGAYYILVAEINTLPVEAMARRGEERDIIKPVWIFDCLEQEDGEGMLLPFEPRHLFRATDAMQKLARQNVCMFADSYCRDIDGHELQEIVRSMCEHRMDVDQEGGDATGVTKLDLDLLADQLEEHGHDLGRVRSVMFRRLRVYFAMGEGTSALDVLGPAMRVQFCSGRVAEELDEHVTHIVVMGRDDECVRAMAADMRRHIRGRARIPQVVVKEWVETSWQEGTVLDEDGFRPV